MKMQGYPGRGSQGSSGPRFSGGVHRATDLAKKRVADAKTRMKQKSRRLGDRVLSQRIRDLVPESKAYMDLLTFEQRLDSTILRKRLEIVETLKRPIKQKRKLRLFISHNFHNLPSKDGMETEQSTPPEWELKIDGRLLDESGTKPETRMKGKFSSFLKNVLVELDPTLYGPEHHLIEWKKDGQTAECDGFQIRRPGDVATKATIIVNLVHDPAQYKLPSKLGKLIGVHTANRPNIVHAAWQYIKANNLQDPSEREYINCDKHLEQIFGVPRMKFSEFPKRLQPLLNNPDPIIIHHHINPEIPEGRRAVCYDIDVEVDDPLKGKMQSFLMSSANQQEVASLDQKVLETVEQINSIKLQREFYLGFSQNPQKFINDWLASQSRDLKLMSGKGGNKEVERRASYYREKWTTDGVTRYFYQKVSPQ
jgi:SWI/SNF-related matrix-associated actin-dependent regulator of chromatin subfamily D